MTTTTASQTLHETPTNQRSPLLLTTGLALLASGVWAVADEFDSRLQRDIADTAYFKAFALTHLVAFGLLAVAAGWALSRGWVGTNPVVRVLVPIGVLLAVCAQWYVAFVTPLLAEVAPESVNRDEGWIGVGLAVALLTAAAALIALGVGVLRAGVLPPVTGWLLVAAGVALVLLPGAQLLAGVALMTARRKT